MKWNNCFIVSVFLVFTLALSGVLFAQRVIDLDKVWGDMRILGEDNDESGSAVAYGDINGDGYDDIIIGAPWADPSGRYMAGRTYVIFGSSSPPSTIDLKTQSADITIYGDDNGDRSGRAVASGDVNGDAFMDIIIGARKADPDGRTLAGKTYVIFGNSSPPATIDLSSQSADITIYGDDEDDWTGSAVASGNVNGDGYDDIIIGARYADSPGGTDAGETYVIFGSSNPPSIVDLKTQSADITVSGDDERDHCGCAVASGDINGDGYDDIIIGAFCADPPVGPGAGETYVIFGSSFLSPPYILDLNSWPADVTIYGEVWGGASGWSVASGDVNNDSYADVIIGAPSADAPGGYCAGGTYVIFGSSSYPSKIDLSTQSADITVYGDYYEDESGYAVASGDVNGDGYDDIIIGAPYCEWYYPLPGKTYLILGGGAIITAHGPGGKSWIKELSLLGRSWGGFKAFGAVNSQGEVHLAVGDVDDDSLDEIAAGHGEEGSSWVKFFEVNGSCIGAFKAFGAANANGEVHLTIGNFDDDLSDNEIAVAHGEGGQSWVKLFEADGTLILSFKTFGADNAQGEVHLASGDLNKDGIDEIIAGMGEGGSSWVKVFNLWGDFIRSFQAFDSTENPGGEVHLAVGNFDADPAVEIAAATGYNGGNKVKLFNKDGTLIREFTAFGFGDNPNGEVQITAADIDNDGIDELICGHGEGGSSMVKVFQADGTFIRSFKAFGAVNAQGEVHLGKSNY